jgi:hypothetical protein
MFQEISDKLDILGKKLYQLIQSVEQNHRSKD